MNFDYYSPDELKFITIDGKQPEDMTRAYECKYIDNKKIKKALKSELDVFVVSTQFKKPKYRFEVGQTVILDSGYEEEAICIGATQNAIRGIRCWNYFFQFV